MARLGYEQAAQIGTTSPPGISVPSGDLGPDQYSQLPEPRVLSGGEPQLHAMSTSVFLDSIWC